MTALFRRTMDATNLTRIANHPDVFPWLGSPGKAGELDLSGVICNLATITLEGPHGGFVLTGNAPGEYEAHSLFLPEGRGEAAVAMAEAGFRYLFTATDCERVVTKVPAGNKAAASLARRVGFTTLFERADAWQGVNGPESVSYQALTVDAWAARDPETLAKGAWFHDQLEAAKVAADSKREVHADDEAHDRAVGAAALMMQAGNGPKAVRFYNRWAALTNFAPITLLSLTPLIVDVEDAIIEVTREGMEILQCR